MKICCPMCSGSGKINPPHFKQKLMNEKRRCAKTLLKEGYSLREIMKAMNYKSVRSIQTLLK